MAKFALTWPFVLLALLHLPDETSAKWCYEINQRSPCVSSLPLNMRQNALIVKQDCEIACRIEGYDYYSVSLAAFCWCLTEEEKNDCPSVTPPQGECQELKCVGGEGCGKKEDSYHVIHKVEISLQFQLTATIKDGDDRELSLTMVADHALNTYSVDLGDGSHPIFVAAGQMETTLEFERYRIAGEYVIAVTSSIPGVPGTHVEVETVDYTNYFYQMTSNSVNTVQCPTVVEPFVDYKCNVSISSLPDDVFTATFDEDYLEYRLEGIVMDLYHIGDPPPRDTGDSDSGDSARNGLTDSEYIYKMQHPVEEPGVTFYFELYLREEGRVEFGYAVPECPGDKVYCHSLRGCEASCPYDDEGRHYTCEGQQVFCQLLGTCTSLMPANTCPKSNEEPTYVKEVETRDNLPKGFHRLLFKKEVKPGYVLFAKGPIGASLQKSANGDTIDGSVTEDHHLFSVIFGKENFYEVTHTCTHPVQPISFRINGEQKGEIQCQWKLSDIALEISQTETDLYDPSLNIAPPFYARSDLPMNYTAIFSIGGSITITVEHNSPGGDSFTETHSDNGNYPKNETLHRIHFSVPRKDVEGCYDLSVRAENLHNPEDPVRNVSSLCILHPVLDVLSIQTSQDTFLIPDNFASFEVSYPPGIAFPSEVSSEVNWGDGTVPETFPIDQNSLTLKHLYQSDGRFTVSARIYNKVSETVATCEVTIIEKIEEFKVTPMYFPTLESDTAHPGYGQDHIMLPLDKNTSFFPSMSRGTVDEYIVRDADTGDVILTYNPVDPFNPTDFPFHHHFNEERRFNLTITAKNVFHEVTVNVSLEIVGMIRGIEIDDYAIVTRKGQNKKFRVTFLTLGREPCMAVMWGDFSTPSSYGGEASCAAQFPSAYHEGNVVTLDNEIYHVYEENGIYNISVTAGNDISQVKTDMMFVVTDIQCAPPKLEIRDAVLFYLDAPRYKKSKPIVVSTRATLFCNVTTKTQRTWQIYHIDPELGELRSPVQNMDTIPSSTKAELTIPGNFLYYGYYQVIYTLRMWDPAILDSKWPFQKSVYTMIEVIKSDLIPVMLKNSVSRITRGRDQVANFVPGVYSSDPDFPDERTFSFEWRSRKKEEEYPDRNGDFPRLIFPKGSGSDGSFGYGPGLLNYSDGELDIFGSDVIGNGGTFVFNTLVRKDSRVIEGLAELVVVPDNVPIVDAKCFTEDFCKPFSEGVYINPTYQVDMTMDCADLCDPPPLKYEWVLYDSEDNLIPIKDEYFPLGNTNRELALSPKFHEDYPDMDMFILSGEITNGNGAKGASAFFMHKNKAPEGGTCTLVHPPTNKALISAYRVECRDWIDREELDIRYKVTLQPQPEGELLTVSTFRHFKQDVQYLDMYFPPGNFKVMVSIIDEWEVFTEVVLEENLEIAMLTEEDYSNQNLMMPMEMVAGEGDVAILNQKLASLTSVINKADWMQTENMTEKEKTDLLLELDSYNNFGMKSLRDNCDFSNLQITETVSSTVASIFATASKNLDILKSVSIDTRETTLDLMGTMIDSLDNMEVIVPDQLQVIGDNLAGVASNIMLGIFQIGTDENCTNTPPSDLRDSDNLPFDTDIGTDIYMTIPEDDTTVRMCNVRDVTKEGGYNQVPKLEKLVDNLAKAALKRSLTGEDWSFQNPNGMKVYTQKIALNGSEWRKSLGEDRSLVQLPRGFCPTGRCGDSVGIRLVSWPYITHSYTAGAKNLALGTKILDADIIDQDENVIPVFEVDPPIIIDIPRTLGKMGNNDMPRPLQINASTTPVESKIPLWYTKFNVSKSHSSINVEITPAHDNHRLFLMVSPLVMPRLSKHAWFTMVKDIPKRINKTYDFFIPSSEISDIGAFFLAVGEFKDGFDLSLMSAPLENKVNISVVKNVSVDFSVRTFTSGCYYFDKKVQDWAADGVEVTYSDYAITRCLTSHLTSFGAGLFIPPNKIDFSYVFANLGFHDNLTIYLTLIVSLTIFLGLMVWARWKDRQDVSKIGATPLPDNHVQDKYLYEILVFTGNRKGAQTDSTVQFILTGEYGESDVRTFGDEKRKIFRKDGVDVFVMATPEPLGKPEYLRIWHDNSGKGPNASWYLSYIVFRDVQTGEKFEFIANRWLALEKDDGQIERFLPLAGAEEKKQFLHLFNTTSNKNLTDGHLWFSVFLRPPRSRFTRCQRVGSCFALLFLSMLANAMWYERVPEQPGTGGLNLGPFSLSPEQIGVGIVSNLIVFPPSFLIVFLFRNSRPRKLRKSRIQLAVEQFRKEFREKHGRSEDRDDLVSCAENQEVEDREPTSDGEEGTNEDSPKTKQRKKKKMTLPFYCSYVAWLLVFACIGASCFFLLMYGVMFGNSKATKWVTSLVISFFSSVLFVQPLKVFLMALIVSAILKSGDHDEDDVEEDEEDPVLQPGEEWMHDDTKRIARRHGKGDATKLESLRHERQQEVGMYEILKEILLYAVFIWILLILSHGNRDPNAYYLQRGLRDSFLYEGYVNDLDFTQVTTTDRLWYYLHTGLLEKLRADTLYNGKPPYGLRGFLEDHTNRIMGYATIRQIRAKKHTCTIASPMDQITERCTGYTEIVNEDQLDYCAGWVRPTAATKNTTDCQMREFKYTTATEHQGYSKWGQLDWYSGGGYVIHLQGPTADVLQRFKLLHANYWIDNQTRAVLVEFSTYNAAVNLFGLALIMAEYTPGGGITPSFRFEGIRLLQHHSNFGGFIIACEVAFILFIVFYTVREIRAMYKNPKVYFKNYWSYAEIAIIVFSYVMMVVYVLRYLATQEVLKVFANTFGNGYVSLSYAALLNEFYLYLVSFIGFVGSLKFIKLLRFNKKIGVLSVTLRQCWDDLAGFLMAFFLCFFTFVNMFYLLLNMHLEGFYNFITSVETCFSMMLGKFQFEEMKQASAIVPLMFFVFVVFNSWVLINLLLTVVIQAFVEIKHDLMKQPNEYEIVDFVWGRFKNFVKFRGAHVAHSGHDPLGDEPSDRVDSPEATDERIQEFPEKVDKFLEYINNFYFDGNLDYHSKVHLRSPYMKSATRGRDDWTGLWDRESGRQRGRSGTWSNSHPSVGYKSGLNESRWAGASDEDYPDKLLKRNQQSSLLPSNHDYSGPRASNKMQMDLDDF